MGSSIKDDNRGQICGNCSSVNHDPLADYRQDDVMACSYRCYQEQLAAIAATKNNMSAAAMAEYVGECLREECDQAKADRDQLRADLEGARSNRDEVHSWNKRQAETIRQLTDELDQSRATEAELLALLDELLR